VNLQKNVGDTEVDGRRHAPNCTALAPNEAKKSTRQRNTSIIKNKNAWAEA
jgi:hypothetical protein